METCRGFSYYNLTSVSPKILNGALTTYLDLPGWPFHFKYNGEGQLATLEKSKWIRTTCHLTKEIKVNQFYCSEKLKANFHKKYTFS